jgi:hypothetical protein
VGDPDRDLREALPQRGFLFGRRLPGVLQHFVSVEGHPVVEQTLRFVQGTAGSAHHSLGLPGDAFLAVRERTAQPVARPCVARLALGVAVAAARAALRTGDGGDGTGGSRVVAAVFAVSARGVLAHPAALLAHLVEPARRLPALLFVAL